MAEPKVTFTRESHALEYPTYRVFVGGVYIGWVRRTSRRGHGYIDWASEHYLGQTRAEVVHHMVKNHLARLAQREQI